MKRKNNVLRIILLIVLSLIIGFSAYSCNAKKVAGNSLPMPLGVGMAVVMSGSMEPELSVDDVIIVKKCADYEIGDVVVFQDGYSLTVHEIVEKDGDTFTTKGTANNKKDAPINIDDVKGKVIFTIPSLGIAVDFIRSPIVTVLIVFAAAYLLLRSYKKEREQDEASVDELKAEIEKLKAENGKNK